MSVGKNGDIDTIYNIGKMDKKNRSNSSLVAQRPSNKNVTSNEGLTSNNSITSSNEKINTITNNSMQNSENNTQNSEKGSFNLSEKDSTGGELSEKQKEYFKDSKVRDEF